MQNPNEQKAPYDRKELIIKVSTVSNIAKGWVDFFYCFEFTKVKFLRLPLCQCQWGGATTTHFGVVCSASIGHFAFSTMLQEWRPPQTQFKACQTVWQYWTKSSEECPEPPPLNIECNLEWRMTTSHLTNIFDASTQTKQIHRLNFFNLFIYLNNNYNHCDLTCQHNTSQQYIHI